MALFGKKSSPELEGLIDQLARSFLGTIHDSDEGRAELSRQISEVATQLRAEGREKAVTSAKSYRPGFFLGLPQEAQQEVVRLLDGALGS